MTNTGPKLLIIEDEQEIRRFLRVSLSHQGYRLLEAEDGKSGILQAAQQQPDVILLDLGLPDMDGLELLTQVRQWSKVPVIVLSARGQEREKVVALDAGADDYLTKPFGIGELLARLRVALRRQSPGTDGGAAEFTAGDLRVDFSRRLVFVRDKETRLTPTEFRLLATLIKHAGRVITHRQLLKEVWGPDSVDETHYLRVFMAQLRQKVEQDSAHPRLLLTEPGVGYRLAIEP